MIGSELRDYGSLIYIKEIAATHANGEMDIKTKGDKVFRILELIKTIPDKLYSGAIVNYPHNELRGDQQVMKMLVDKMKDLHASLQVKKTFIRTKGI
ncbi:hypothetical protein [Niabella hibiscisoli]|uniref:hypothetical protein n=1 Tax=Niabella hibiscisoli TaxID=1825928 RepID=UPI001F0D9BB6|nr:hypothetical protein [Niabella hibiscisoli]MCH5716533.1 hypothetical protein [Niabella hibiscisoli]